MNQQRGGAVEDRDFLGEMDALIDAMTQGSDWVPAVVAAKLAESVEPALLDGWLREMAVALLTSVISRRERSTRAAARTRAGSRAFAAAAPALESGDPETLSSFAVTYAIDDDNTRRRVADMTGPDHLFVAADYEKDAKPLLMLAAFHKAVAKKVGSKRTSDVFSEAKYDQLFRSITGKPATAEAA